MDGHYYNHVMTIAWIGLPPDRALRRVLAAADIRVGRPAGACDVVVVASGEARRLPRAPRVGTPWLWVTRGGIGDAAAVEVASRGAYDAIALDEPGAAARLLRRLAELQAPLPAPPDSDVLVTRSAISRTVVAQVARVAATSMPVLLVGETGTGKEIMARTIHAWSVRHAKPFIPINCAAIPNELMEAELFGYARGAFSGAVQQYDGQLMAAQGGTVFLDEIDDTPLETQVKLLRVLEDRVVSRIGQNEWHEVDFRLLAATNRDLAALVSLGLFGEDLYSRLAIVTIRLPPLRERPEDIEDLALQFAARFAREQQRSGPITLGPQVARALQGYPWPGNIRELRNVIYETLVYKRAGSEVLLSDLPGRVLKRSPDRGGAGDEEIARRVRQGSLNLRDEIEALERTALDEALKVAGGNAAAAARLLGAVGRGTARDPGSTVRAMMRRLKRR
jgi:transcriptional regulator with PAS, ATPase and Fis domain